jgi:lipid-A-disaccharide synthase
LRVGIVAGEASGDILGAGLIVALREIYPNAEFVGIGGEEMVARGMVSFYPLDRLSVMGLVDPLKRLPELLRMRSNLVRHFQIEPPDIFIGIDSPDFNLGIELKLRRIGITTAHYVSPSVWAWRQGRVAKIARAVNLMLTLFPFEAAFYREHRVPVAFVGHPLADELAMEPNPDAARELLQCGSDGRVVALLPGSRSGEIAMLGPVFLQAAVAILQRHPDCQVLIPAANDERHQQLQALLGELDPAPEIRGRIRLLQGQSKLAMTAADVVLMTSGTTTLEAMLLKKPMVVAYKLSPLSYWVLSRLVKTEFIALPNLLAGEALVPELLQDQVTVESLSDNVALWLEQPQRTQALQQRFADIHRELRRDASHAAAQAIAELVEQQ